MTELRSRTRLRWLCALFGLALAGCLATPTQPAVIESTGTARPPSPTAPAPTEQLTQELPGVTALGRAAGLRARLTSLLGEHVMLAAEATGAALAGREAEFEVAAGALDRNSIDLAAAIGSVYGPDIEGAFLPLWRTHIGFFADYTVAVGADDATNRDFAVADLLQYAKDFGAVLNSINPRLAKDAVAGLVEEHVSTLLGVIDAQAKGDLEGAYAATRLAYAHMSLIADALAEGIVQQFPDEFR
ncbi:MAG TPA: hypothetical protein VJ123_02315 [Anaerolineales bacterium]|nr:hypothetical protein [Anaerolineales bacterium]